MEFLRIKEKNIEELKKLQIGYKKEIGEDEPTEANFNSLKNAIENEEILFYGCICEDNLVACCSVSITYSTFNYEKAGVFEDFYIKPEFRHKGIARKLLAYAYKQSGISSLTVGCAECDLAMYKALGFSIELGNMLAYED